METKDRATLSYDLSDFDSKLAFQRAVLADDMAGVLWDLRVRFPEDIRSRIEYGNKLSGEEVLTRFLNFLEDELYTNGINLDKIYP